MRSRVTRILHDEAKGWTWARSVPYIRAASSLVSRQIQVIWRTYAKVALRILLLFLDPLAFPHQYISAFVTPGDLF